MKLARAIAIDELDHKARLRFWRMVKRGDGCWEWQGAVANGYGRFKVGGALYGAHRIAVVFASGRDVPGDLCVDHLCRNRACVRVSHLEVVSFAENVLRGEVAKARSVREFEKSGRCLQGHLRDSLSKPCAECDRQYKQKADVKERNRLRARRARATGRWVDNRRRVRDKRQAA